MRTKEPEHLESRAFGYGDGGEICHLHRLPRGGVGLPDLADVAIQLEAGLVKPGESLDDSEPGVCGLLRAVDDGYGLSRRGSAERERENECEFHDCYFGTNRTLLSWRDPA